MPRDDLTSSFQIGRTPAAASEDGRPEPRFAAIPLQIELDEARRIEAGHAATQPSASSQLRGRTLPFGMLGALAVHLSPLLLLLSWTSAPADIVEPIPVELVLEQPPPPPESKPEAKAEKPPPPPLGRLASVDMGEPVNEAQPPASSPDQPPSEPAETQIAAARPPPPPELVSALPKPISPPEPLTAVPPLPEPAPPAKPAPKPAVASAHPPKRRPARPLLVPGPDATRDEYLAYITTLINRQSHLLAPPLTAGRHGVTVISIMVLGDGTIARLAVKRSSGYRDIDAKVQQMIAAVRRFPPLPQWIQAPSVMLDYHRVFPSGLGGH